MRDRFVKKLEDRLPDYVTKYKTGVLEKYGIKTSSDSSTEDEQSSKGEREVKLGYSVYNLYTPCIPCREL